MEELRISTDRNEELIDITGRVAAVVQKSKAKDGICVVYVPHATAAVVINENADPGVGRDIIKALNHAVPQLGYEHDNVDGNARAHIKSAIAGPSVTIPVREGKLLLGRWQGILFCEFDGPRQDRRILVEVIGQ